MRFLFILAVALCAPVRATQGPIAGEVVVEFYVDAKGKPRDIRVVRATDESFAKKAVDGVKKWTLEEKYRNKKMTVPVVFDMPEDQPRKKHEPKKKEG